MAHINTGKNGHDHTVSAFIILLGSDEPRLGLHMHRKVGKLLQFGGHVEVDENIWEAIEHELVEETGYALSQLKVLQPTQRLRSLPSATVHPVPVVQNTHNYESGNTNHRHIDNVYAFIATELPSGVPEEGETPDILWVTRDELAAFTASETSLNAQAIGEWIFAEILNVWEPVELSEFGAEK